MHPTGQHPASSLADSDSRFRELFEQASAGFARTDLDGRFTAVNDRYCAITGRTREELLKLRMQDITSRDDLGENLTHFKAALAGGPSFEIEKRYTRPDGSIVWVRNSVSGVRDKGGEIEGILAVSIDITDRKQVEQALRDSEARYRTLFNSIESGFCVVEVSLGSPRIDYRVTEANPAFYRQTGFTEEILGRWLREAAPDLEELWFEIYGRIARTGHAERFEQRSTMLGRWFDVYGFRIGEPSERRVAILFNDVSARRRAEERLRELNETLETQVAARAAELDRLWNLSQDMLARADYSGMIRAVSPAWTLVLGWDEDELLSRPYVSLIHPQDASATLSAIGEMATARTPTRYENRIAASDGSWKHIEWTVAPEPDGLNFIAVGRDLTETRLREAELAAAEQARRQADALYRAYFENAPEALFVIGVADDGGFVVEEINPAHERGVGLKLEEIRGKPVNEILPVEAAEKVISAYRQVIVTGEIVQYREAFELNGDSQHWDTSLLPMRDSTGRISRIIGSSRNVTRQVVAEDALRQSQKMEAMGSLTGGVAHDFNNLLTPIIGSLDMLMRKNIGSERERRLIHGALQSADRAKTLVQRLLAFARRQPLRPIAVDVRGLVEGLIELISSTLGPAVDLRTDFASGLPPAKADPNQLEMALLNLAVNARDAMPQGGELTISAHAATVTEQDYYSLVPGDYIRISVGDTGLGMNEDTRKRAVEPFFSTKGVGKGTGLGLSMVHGLTAQLGGGLAIQSEPGRGTTVDLWLPVSAESLAVEGIEQRSPDLPIGRGTALLVDDEELVRMSTADMLIELGFQVIEADSAQAALSVIDSGICPDLVITDHLMPGMTGAELARTLRTKRPELPVLIVSGYAEAEGIAPDMTRLAKPFRNAELAACVSTLFPGASDEPDS